MKVNGLLVMLASIIAIASTKDPMKSDEEFEQNQHTRDCFESFKYHYSVGTTYIYDYSAEATTSVAGASEDKARVAIHTNGHIDILSPCMFSLQMKNVSLLHSDGNENMKTAQRESQFRSGLEMYSLRFSFQDGKINDIYPSDGDFGWMLNFKKGFLSVFQNSMEDIKQNQNVTESDVAGICKTEYTVVSNDYDTTTVNKTKKILSCTDRHNFESVLQAIPYHILSDIQSLPLMKTSHECQQLIETGGILRSAICSESHIFRPFSNGKSGVSTTVIQKLTYQTQKESSGSSAVISKSKDTLIFNYKVTKPTKDKARLLVEQKLIDICDHTDTDIKPEAPRLFAELVDAMKFIDADDMEDLYYLLKTKTLHPGNAKMLKFYLDALPMINTHSSVRLITKLINRGKIREFQATAWLMSLAFIPQPTSEMILDVKTLIDFEKFRKDALLPVSALLNNYCKRQSSCDQDHAVLSIMSTFERIIGHNCDVTDKTFDEILLSLRAIGNVRHARKLVNILNKCLTMISNPTEIRVAAINAFRRMPCTAEDMHLWNLLKDKSTDSELRISAYLAIMRCPNASVLENITSFLSNEDNDQVGVFVYSHLTNLMESSNPHKQRVAEMIKKFSLDKKFDTNPIRFSRNFEASTLVKKINAGFTAEGNLIWSNSDKLPRSLAGNLSVELFGQSINVFDFGIRLEGLGHVLKEVLRPFINLTKKPEENINFAKVQGSVFGRIFGNEIFYVHSKTVKSSFGNLPYKWLNALMNLAKMKEMSLTKSLHFIDASMVIPSFAGLPIKLHVNGTAVVDFTVRGMVDPQRVGASIRPINVDGEVRSSAAFEVTGTMAVDAFVTKIGLRMRNTMYLDSTLKGRIQLNKRQQVNVELDMPKDKMEIFGARSQFYILYNDMEKEQELIKENRKEFKKCTGVLVTSITGLELCQQLSYPNASLKSDGPFFPLTGPTALKISVFKKDTHSAYALFAKRIENKKESIVQFSFKTPGSKINRAIVFDWNLNYIKQSMEMNMLSPWKKAKMKANIKNTNNEKGLTASFSTDERNVYSIYASNLLTFMGTTMSIAILKNKFNVKTPGNQLISISGSGYYRKDKSLKIDTTVAVHLLMKRPASLKVRIAKNSRKRGSQYHLDVLLSSRSMNAHFECSMVVKQSRLISTKTSFAYNMLKFPEKKIVFHGKFNDRSNSAFTKYLIRGIFDVRKNPDYNMRLNLNVDHMKKGSKVELDLRYGRDTKDKKKKIHFLTSLTQDICRVKKCANVIYSVKVEAPEHNIDIFLIGKHLYRLKFHCSNILLQYGKSKSMKAELKMKDQSTILTNLYGRMNVQWPGNEYIFNTTFIQNSTKEYSHTFNIKHNHILKFSVFTTYKIPNFVTHDISTQVKFYRANLITLKGITTLSVRNLYATGMVTHGKDIYGVTNNFTVRARKAYLNFQIIHPARRMALDVNFERNKNELEGYINAHWNVDKNDSRIILAGVFMYESYKGFVKIGGRLNIHSPFSKFENLFTSIKYKPKNRKSEINMDGKFSWDGKHKQFVSFMEINKDLSLRKCVFSFKLMTPFRGFKSAKLDVDHNLGNNLNTMFKGCLENKSFKIVLWSQKNDAGYRTDLLTDDFIPKSTSMNANILTSAFFQSLSNVKLFSSGEITCNGNKYDYAINMINIETGMNFNSEGNLTVKMPQQNFYTEWDHGYRDNTFKFFLNSTLDRKTIVLDLSGCHEISNFRKVNLDLEMKSFWTKTTDIEISLCHKHGNSIIETSSLMNQNGKSKISSYFKFKSNANNAYLDFHVKTPISKDLKGRLKTQFDKYHMMTSAEISCDSCKNFSFETFLNFAPPGEGIESHVDCKIEIQTPFDNFQNMGLIIFHSGNASNFSSSAILKLMGDEKIKKFIGNIHLTALSVEHIELATSLSTPFENFRYIDAQFKNYYERLTSDITGSITISLPIACIGNKGIHYHKHGNFKNMIIEVVTTDNGDEASIMKISIDFYGKHIYFVFDVKDVSFLEMHLALDNHGDMNKLNVNINGNFGQKNVLKCQANFTMRSDVINGEGNFMYSIEDQRMKQGLITFHKEGTMNDMTIVITTNIGNKMSPLYRYIKTTNELSVFMDLNTAMKQYRDVCPSTRHSENIDNFECHDKNNITPMYKMIFMGKIQIDHHSLCHFESNVELTTPIKEFEPSDFKNKYNKGIDNLKSPSTLDYGNSKKLVYDLKASISPKHDIKLSIKTPGTYVSSFGKLEYTWPKYGIKCSLVANNRSVLIIDGTLDVSDDIIGTLKVETPFENFTNVGLCFSHYQMKNGFDSRGHVTYMDDNIISGETVIAILDKETRKLSVIVKTPFSGYESTKFEQIHIITRKLLKSTTSFFFKNNQTIIYEMRKTGLPKQELAVSLKTTFKGFEELSASISNDNKLLKYSWNSKIIAANRNNYNFAGSFDISRDILVALEIESPYKAFSHVGLKFLHSGNYENFNTQGKLTYMHGKEIGGKVNFYRYMWNRIFVLTELNTPVIGMEHTMGEINFENNSYSIGLSGALEYGIGQKYRGNLKFTHSPNYDLVFSLRAPFTNNKFIRTQGSLDITSPSYELAYSVHNGFNKIYYANGKFNFHSVNNLDASIEMNTPISVYELTQIEYKHKFQTYEVEYFLSLRNIDGQKMGIGIRTQFDPRFDASFSIDTPFIGFKNFQLNVASQKSYKRCEILVSLDPREETPYYISSEMDMLRFPVKISCKVNSPYAAFRKIELILIHDGEPSNFVSTAFFASPLTNDITAKAALKYESVLNMAASASLQSVLPEFDKLRTEYKIENGVYERKVHLLMGWTSGQELIIDSTYKLQHGWFDKKISSNFYVSTPFTSLQRLVLEMGSTEKGDHFSGKTELELNGKTLLDIEGDYRFKDSFKIQLGLTLNQPRPMLYTVSMSHESGCYDAEIFIDWNRKMPNSNIFAQTILSDKSNVYKTENNLVIRVIQTSQRIDFDHKVNFDCAHVIKSGHVFWDSHDNNRVILYLNIKKDNSWRRKEIIDSSVKLGFPSRTLGFTSSYRNTKLFKAANLTISWDSDRGNTKQLGINATINHGDGIKGDITLSLPTMRKEIHVNGEILMKDDHFTFDTITDFSDLHDTQDTYTLTSKLSDVSDCHGNYNYSMSLGISHPCTNLDLQIDSQLSSSDKLTTFGMNTNYMNTMKQVKNMALVTEINKIKKQINFQVKSPMNRFEFAGDLVSSSPLKFHMVKRINNLETFRSDLTVNQRENSFIFNAVKNSEAFTDSAKLDAAMALNSLDKEFRNSSFNVSLNTSRLISTRLSWLPEMVNKFRVLFLEKALVNAMNPTTMLSEMNEAICNQISLEYTAITEEMRLELQPFMDAMNEELFTVATKMKELSSELTSIYNRNMGDEIHFFYTTLQERLISLTNQYRSNYYNIIRSIMQSLGDLETYPIRQLCTQAVKDNAQWVAAQASQASIWLDYIVGRLDTTYNEYQDKVSGAKCHALAWDPDHGEIQADLLLSMIVKRLGDMTELPPFMNKIEEFIKLYLFT